VLIIMYHRINSQNQLGLVSLSEVKAHCRLTSSFTKDDSYLDGLISTCSNLAQLYCNRLLVAGEVSVSLDYYAQCVQLWGGEIESIKSITSGLITITDFTFNPITQKLTLPDSAAYRSDFTITYDAGYTDLPKQVKQAVLLMISTMYNNRDDYVTGLTVANLPFSSKILLNSVKHYVS
jgi:hypothetical protein